MNLLRPLRFRLRALFRGAQLDREMDEEMRFHLEMEARANVADCGTQPMEARRAAAIAFGGRERVREEMRDARGVRWMEDLVRDTRHALRSLRRTPAFTAIAIFTLALGIGLVTVQLSFLYGVSFTGPRFAGADRVVSIFTRTSSYGDAITSLRHFLELRTHQTSFKHIAAFRRGGMVLRAEDVLAHNRIGAECTADVFSISAARPRLGRVLHDADNESGAPRVVVLGHRVWQQDFTGDPSVVGRAVRVNGELATVVGVMPADFEFPIADEIWTNLRLPATTDQAGWLDPVQVIAQRRPEVDLPRARAEIEGLVARVAADAPTRGPIGRHADVVPFARGELGTPFVVILWTLFTLAALVLVLACVNVANLFFARALRQRHELAVRTALGASRSRLVRQMLTMSLLLAGTGAAGGVLLAQWMTPLMNVLLADPRKPYWMKVETDWHVLTAVIALTLVIGAIAGVLPAFRSLRLQPNLVLREGGGAGGTLPGRTKSGLSLAQIALAATVLMVGMVLGRGVIHVARENIPAGAERVLSASGLSAPSQNTDSQTVANERLLPELLERAAKLPGVEQAAAVGRGLLTPIMIENTDPAESAGAGQFPSVAVSADYFAVFGVGPLRGRIFNASDFLPNAAPVVVLNESAARRFWPAADPVGRRIRFESREGLGDWHTVAGIVPDLPLPRSGWHLHVPGVYAPLDLAAPGGATLLLRAAGNPAALTTPLRTVLSDVAPDRVFNFGVQPLPDAIAADLQIMRLLSGLASVFGGAGMLLAALGIFGVQAFFVESRHREFGVRLALGARPVQLLALVLKRGAWHFALGAPPGLACGWALDRVLQSTMLLRPVAQVDATAVVLVCAVLVTAVLAGCWQPARRAAKVDPMIALRAE